MKVAKSKTPAQSWDLNIKRSFRARVKTEIVDAATGIAVKTSSWVENLAFDRALTGLLSAQFFNVCDLFANLKIGSGVSPNSIAGGAITFTQAGTTITASGAFFTAAMVGGIFKYGTGSAGAEQYIATVAGGGLSCTVLGPGMAVGIATVATVWQVQQTSLETWLATATSYQTNPGDNSTVIAGGSITLQRTFIFATPVVTQNINEIGYDNANAANGTCRGRIVLPSTDVVDNTHFYRVVMQMIFIVAPSAPTAFGNVGTNIDTSGNVMFEWYDFEVIQPNGGGLNYQSGAGGGTETMDGGTNAWGCAFRTAPWTQPGAIQLGLAPGSGETYQFNLNAFNPSGQPVGVGVSTTNFSLTTAGETMTGITFGGNGGGGGGYAGFLTLQLTTPFTLPTGTFQGSISIKKVFTRTLTN